MRSKGKKGNRRVTAGASRHGESFDDFFGDHYGQRWATLRKSLSLPTSDHAVLWNKFVKVSFETVMKDMKRVDDTMLLQLFRQAEDGEMAPLVVDEFGVKAYYPLNYTAALAVEQLGVQPFDRVLDLCAGSGGKSIAIAQFLSNSALLTSNEQHGDRFSRLSRNIKEYVPSNYVPITVTQRKAETWFDPSTYQRVLVDAPCTSERRLLQQCGDGVVSSHQWSLQACRELSRHQRALLLCAIETCLPGGRVVYTTCSISPLENDIVVKEALQRTRCQVQLVPVSIEIGEVTECGRIVLPDRDGGRGPAYYSIIHKISERREDSSEDESESNNGSAAD
uniref:NOL1/NOP2/Sun domain family member 4 n=1 Tax=Trypanosoma congolense (strain IL3000) TaxID=1068625 RepID=G0V333_TRYCI|nr:unnamed protein product [Trypanosoma congolense IL3000]